MMAVDGKFMRVVTLLWWLFTRHSFQIHITTCAGHVSFID